MSLLDFVRVLRVVVVQGRGILGDRNGKRQCQE